LTAVGAIHTIGSRGVEQRQLVGLITRRSAVRIRPPQPVAFTRTPGPTARGSLFLATVRKSLPPLRRTAGLPARTTRRTVPDMFGRYRTAPDREVPAATAAFHDRLAVAVVSARTNPPRVEARDLRARLGGSSVGLRARIDRGLGAT
jgi:hypothetical protein